MSLLDSNNDRSQHRPLFGAIGNVQSQLSSNPFGFLSGSLQPQQPSNIFSSSTNTAQPQQNGGLFSSSTNSQPQQAGGLFGKMSSPDPPKLGGIFGSTTTSQSEKTGGLFGSSSNTSQPQQSGGLFGTKTASQPQQTSNIFGLPVAGSQQQQPSGGLFGSSAQQSSGPSALCDSNATQQAQPQQATLLFGGTLGQTQDQNQSNQAGGVFGNAGTQNKSALSLFGGSNTISQKQEQKPSLFTGLCFGQSTNNQQQQQKPSLFGSETQSIQQRPLLGNSGSVSLGLTMGQGNSQSQQQTIPGVKIDVSQIRGTTRFNDLHEEVKKEIEHIDALLQLQISFKEQCDAVMPVHKQNLSYISNDVEFIQAKVDTVELALDNDSSIINQMKGVVQKDAKNANISFRAIENLKLPQLFHYSGMWHGAAPTVSPPRDVSGVDSANDSMDLVSYFENSASEMSKTLITFQQNIAEIEAHLRTVEASTIAQSQQPTFEIGRHGAARSKDDQVRELATVLREFEVGILSVAGKVEGVREKVTTLVMGRHGQGQGRGRY